MSDERTHLPSKGYYGYRYIKSPTDMPFVYRYFSEVFTPSQKHQSTNNSNQQREEDEEGSELRGSHKGVQPMVGYGGHCRGGRHAKVGRSIAHKASIEQQDGTYRIRKHASQSQLLMDHQQPIIIIPHPTDSNTTASDSLSSRLRRDNDGYLKRVLQRKQSFR